MAASFPSSVKSFTTKTNSTDIIDASHINDHQDETVAIENVLLGNTAADIKIDGDITTEERFIAKEGGDTTTPASGYVSLYAKADGKLYSKDDAGAETLVSSAPATTKQLYVANFKPTLTNGAADSAQIEMGTNKNVYDYLAFDASSIEYAYANVPMPSDWDASTVTATFYWLHPATATNFGVVWGLQGVAMANDDPLDVAQGTVQTVADTGGTTSDLYISAATSAMTIAGSPAAGEYVQFRVQRTATDGSDTMTVDAYLLGALITYGVT